MLPLQKAPSLPASGWAQAQTSERSLNLESCENDHMHQDPMFPDPEEAVDWLAALGILRYANPGQLTHVPVALTPYGAPEALLEEVEALTAVSQTLMHRVADDGAFLRTRWGP